MAWSLELGAWSLELLEVELWTDNSLSSASVDRILLGQCIYMDPYRPAITWKLPSEAQQAICDMYCMKMTEI